MKVAKIILSSVFGLCLATSQQSLAASASSKYVDEVKLSFIGQAAKLRVENSSANKHVSKVNLKLKDSALKFDISGRVDCNPGIGRHFKGGYMTFGPLSLRGGNIDTSLGVYTKQADVAYTEKKNDLAEYTPTTFTVPVSKVKNASPSLRVDPVAEINKKLQQHLQGGGKAVDFYKQDHTIVLQRPLTLSGICGTNTKSSGGYHTKNHTIQIEYKADPAVYEKAKLNAALGGNLPNQINNNLPFKLDQAKFQANMPHYIGKCMPNQDPKIRINFQVSGSTTGLIDLRVVQVSNQYALYGTYFETTGIVKNPKNGGGHLDFRFPLKDMLSQQKYSYMAIANNKTYEHNMRIEARYKNMQGGTWSAYKPFGTATFKHRCTPQLNQSLGNQNQVKQFDNAGPAKSKPKRAEPSKPARLERATQ